MSQEQNSRRQEKRQRLTCEIRRIEPRAGACQQPGSMSRLRRSRSPLVSWALPSLGHLRDMLAARAGRRSTTWLANSPAAGGLAGDARRGTVELGLSQQSRWRSLYNGVDLETCSAPRPVSRQPAPRTGPACRQAKLVGCIGQLGLRKGVDTFVAARRWVGCARRRYTSWSSWASATRARTRPSRYEAELHRAAAGRPPLAGRCHFLGRRDDVPQPAQRTDPAIARGPAGAAGASPVGGRGRRHPCCGDSRVGGTGRDLSAAPPATASAGAAR